MGYLVQRQTEPYQRAMWPEQDVQNRLAWRIDRPCTPWLNKCVSAVVCQAQTITAIALRRGAPQM